MPLPSYTYSGAVYSSPAVGSTTFNLTTSGGAAIGFLDPSHIRVFTTLNGGATLVERFRPAQWEFNSAGTQVILVAPTIATEAVILQRVTPIVSSPIVVPDGINLPAQKLRDLSLYTLYVAQEQFDSASVTLQLATDASTQAAITLSAVANQLPYTPYANRAAVPINPGSAVSAEVIDSTNMQTFTPLTGRPAGFIGSASLIVRMRYSASLATWQWIDYRAADADARYLLKAQLINSVGSTSVVDPPTANAVKVVNDKAVQAQVEVDAVETAVAVLQTATAVQYVSVGNVASIPTGVNGSRVEIANSTGIETFTPLSNRPGGFIGSASLAVRLVYNAFATTWQWVDYRPVDPDSRYATAASLAAGLASVRSDIVGKNRLINGGMAVNQRGIALMGVGPTPTYLIDRWFAFPQGGFCNFYHVAGATANQYRCQFDGIPGITEIAFSQRIEALNSADLAGGVVTISVDLANNLLTSVDWQLQYAGATDNFASLSSIASGTWTVNSTIARYTAQATIPIAAVTGLQLTFSVGAQVSGSWTIGDAQLEKGSTASSPDKRSYGQELSLCQRYFENVPFALIGTSSVANRSIGNWIQFAEPKRAVPTPRAGGLVADPAIVVNNLSTPNWTTRITTGGYLASASVSSAGNQAFYYGAMIPMDAEL